jgi:PPOX class probable FMN-dependent enzyme
MRALHRTATGPVVAAHLAVRAFVSKQRSVDAIQDRAMTALTSADLDRLYPAPTGRAVVKTMNHIDRHAGRFIALSPFCVVATAGGDDSLDISPRGGEAGFVKVETPNRLLLPDRPGNNRLDSFRNLVGGTGGVALIFFIPGVDETLRVNGRAWLSVEPEWMERLHEFGKPPRSVLVVEVQEALLHCAKALMRSKLWSPEARVERSVLPTLGQMLNDQLGRDDPVESQADMQARYREQF